MLRTMIQTTEEGTGKQQQIPTDLLAKVQRADGTLKTLLRKVGDKIDIEARWWFEPTAGGDFDVMLSLWTDQHGRERGTGYPFPKDDLRDEESIRRRLWTPIGYLIPKLEEEVDRRFESVRRDLEALSSSAED